ncbi:phosphonate metabolism protein/1,5-bisphosphokinase (PRPP-forming) PhnN [Cohaesibacter celericrescens]|uniref:Ribose 1,5-bisphosphate phosphokinase PhnN n=1 Tax=Cohaesibacter celericrescens TaxID=2067669 RepID=A0A2N5XQV5_9HYPH|nr:phosphonate metabolism protein/1,5-bisphosphokinase (PRPP-forming) PhnN [Cohaesibacter celericrescens]PLW76902.1 phosphonate metabolism protein/1,5-bisphosphokinase (PRPP-forming) PhnN [Cohaesibacter celericrescens]
MNDNNSNDPASDGYGTLVLLVGPSGSGKDSVLDWARLRLADDKRILFVRRCITRDNADSSEDHDSMTIPEFQKAEMQGDFILSWNAHGLYYGLPVTLLEHLKTGGVAIANGSRKTLPLLREQFPHFEVINLTVEPEILAARLAKRGRESAEEIKQRLARTQTLQGEDLFDVKTHHIDNSSDLALAGQAFVDLVLSWADKATR